MKKRLTDTEAMERIHKILSGQEWSADQLEWIADVVTATGREILPPGEEDEA
jgi:hypothetical protein